MKLKYAFESINMGDEIIAVPVGKNAHNLKGVLKLNKEGFDIIDSLKTETSEEEIIDQLSLKYNTEYSIVQKYVHNVIEYLKSVGALEE